MRPRRSTTPTTAQAMAPNFWTVCRVLHSIQERVELLKQ